ncbi:hypothetical protein O6H91_08G110200 [Diphasiastrum complanatum]|uniref:Uncharacterized protein n=1 Tax=Diphasiastrum complanatum TaxID=34168 RepID=A0ACC2D1A6_DIPCM|nr:hypothetical protein O6H91_08G110200 [Diphasiastrum complanatum]
MMGYKDQERSGVCEVIKGRLYFAILQRPEDLKGSWLPRPALCFSTDNELVYEPFFQDFGPLNIACTYRFCWKLKGLLIDAEAQGRCVCYCCSIDPKKKPNAAVLLGAYLVLFEDWDADAAYLPLASFEPYLPFRDPTSGISTYHLSVLDCIRAMVKGKKVGWIDFSSFNLQDYEYFEQVENGDLNWIVPNKLVAFSGPAARRSKVYGYRTLVPEDYVEYFKRAGITVVIRLNKKLYDRRRFTDHGIGHHDLYFPDGSCPPERIVHRFLEIVEETPGALAVHCKAGLGRTGVLIGCFIMKHYKFIANEVMGYLRLMRPGSVIGPQQHFLRDMQSRMWKAGSTLRHQKSPVNRNWRHHFPLSVHDTNNESMQDSATSSSMSMFASPSTSGTSVWSQGKGSLTSSKSYAANPIVRKVSSRDADHVQMENDDYTGSSKFTGRSPEASMSLLNVTRSKGLRGTTIERAMHDLFTHSSSMSAKGIKKGTF